VILDRVQAVLALFDAVQHMCDRDRQRFYFFDLGVRHAAARLSNTRDTVLADPGPLFEQWVGIEIWKRLQYRGEGALSCYRTKAGAEVDFIVELGGKLIPLEVKWTEHPTRRGRALPAYVPGRQPRPRTDGLSRVPLRAPPAPLGARDGTAVVGGVASPVARALGRGGRRRAAAGDARRRV